MYQKDDIVKVVKPKAHHATPANQFQDTTWRAVFPGPDGSWHCSPAPDRDYCPVDNKYLALFQDAELKLLKRPTT